MIALLFATLIQLTGPDGQIIWLNPEQVTSIREPRGLDRGHWTQNTKCLIMTVDGKFFTTSETCTQVRKKLDMSRGGQ